MTKKIDWEVILKAGIMFGFLLVFLIPAKILSGAIPTTEETENFEEACKEICIQKGLEFNTAYYEMKRCCCKGCKYYQTKAGNYSECDSSYYYIREEVKQ